MVMTRKDPAAIISDNSDKTWEAKAIMIIYSISFLRSDFLTDVSMLWQLCAFRCFTSATEIVKRLSVVCFDCLY